MWNYLWKECRARGQSPININTQSVLRKMGYTIHYNLENIRTSGTFVNNGTFLFLLITLNAQNYDPFCNEFWSVWNDVVKKSTCWVTTNHFQQNAHGFSLQEMQKSHNKCETEISCFLKSSKYILIKYVGTKYMDQIFQEYLNYKLLHTLNTFHIILFCIKKQISEII